MRRWFILPLVAFACSTAPLGVVPTVVTAQQHVACAPTPACAEQIVRATFAEFPSLVAAQPTVGASVARAEELLRRIIWHLRLAGFQAGRQRNPSGLVSNDKLSVHYADAWHAIDIATDWDVPNVPMRATFTEVPGVNPVPDDGIADESAPPPPPPPPPPVVDLKALAARVEAVEAKLQAVVQAGAATWDKLVAVEAGLHEARAALGNVLGRIEVLEARPIPTTCRARLNLGFVRAPVECTLGQ